ncbi:MAG TPA: hypothetical protein PLX89_27110 [Verrucomicrobiota bacterium]|nr:hypothetical protein [Verrucomicrobiota bacterium]
MDKLSAILRTRQGRILPRRDRVREIFSRLRATCHRLGSIGTELGPNLQSVANHTPEHLLDPNATNEPGYTGTLANGEELYGLIAAETVNSRGFAGIWAVGDLDL